MVAVIGMESVARVRRNNMIPTLNLKCKLIWQIWRDKKFLSPIGQKIEWESPPSILVTRNPNWSQRSGTGTGCVMGRY